MNVLMKLWQLIRHLADEDAYENYCTHHTSCHSQEVRLSRKDYFKQLQSEKWEKMQRCC